MDVKIRKASERDLEGLLKLNHHIHEEVISDPDFGDYIFIKEPSANNVRKWLRKMLADVRKGNSIYMVAEVNRQLVGHCLVRRVVPGSERAHTGDLALRVDTNYRGKGIGGSLLDSMLAKARGKFEMLSLQVFSTNKVAKHLYKSRGFRRFGIEPRAVKRGKRYFDLEHYYLKLDSSALRKNVLRRLPVRKP